MFRAIKFLRTVLMLTVVSLSVSASSAMILGGSGGDHPWPWGLEVPFPWEDIQGIWKINKPGKTFYLSFRRLESKRLAVNQFDLDNCIVTAGGPGFEKEKTVVAQMNEFGTRNVYRLTLYAFNPKDSPEPPAWGGAFDPGHVMVARINALSSPSPELAFQMVKMTDRLEVRCVRQNKTLTF